MSLRLMRSMFLIMMLVSAAAAQDKVVIIPKSLPEGPFVVEDSTNLFEKAYRFFIEGETALAADSLRKLVAMSNFHINPKAYYIVVANFTDRVSPIGLFHEGSDFLDTRLYGLKTDSLYYMFISRTENAPSFISVMLKTKQTPFEANLPAFLQLLGFGVGIQELPRKTTTWIDVRRFEIPDKFKRVSDIAVIVKDSLKTDRYLASAVFDNTPLERWSYGIATAITTLNDVELEVGEDGTIIVKPKPNGDLAAFGVINFHFKAVDTKAPTLASSLHLLGGLRIAPAFEPILGVGFGIPVTGFELHLFGGGSLALKNVLKEGFAIGQKVEEEVDPFKIEAKLYPRFGLEIKFP